jgi:hypothetical protein
MRYRLLASYQGAPYEAGVGPQETGVVLFAACPPPEDLGFEPATGHWRKHVERDDVQTLYESRPVGVFRGERCVVLDELSDRLHIAYLGHDAHRAEQLGFWEVDRGVFELITPRQEVTEIVEQRVQVAAPGEGSSYPESALPPSGAPYGYDAGHANGSRPHRPVHDPLTGPELLTPVSPPASVPADHPLPLEAEAMRAARKAKENESKRDGDHGPAPAGPALPPVSKPAGISEPSSVLQPGDGATSVPSWSPRPQVPPQRQDRGSGRITESATGWPSVPEPPVPEASVAHPSGPAPSVPQPYVTELPATTAAPAAGQALSGPAAPGPALGDPAIHGVPLPAPAGAAQQASPPDPAEPPTTRTPVPEPAPGATRGGATSPPQPAAPVDAAAVADGATAAAGQGPGVSLQRPAAAFGAAAGRPAQAGPAPLADPQPVESFGGVNGIYHSGPASHGGQASPPAAPGLPRDQFERPLYAVASSAPAPAAPGDPAAPRTAAGPAGAPGLSVGVAVADPMTAFPYAPTAPYAPPAPSAPPATPAQSAPAGRPGQTVAPAAPSGLAAAPPADPADPAETAQAAGAQPASRRRRASRRRLPTQRIFADLAAQAGIPPGAYAINEDADGAMCLVSTGEGFEVFNSLAGARHEVRVFQDEESAYFYLFGVLAAEAVRTGMLGPTQ